jgi:hypothetical protein
MNPRRQWRGAALAACLVLLAACASPPQPLLHRAHREYFALQIDDLERARYFVSERIVAHELIDGADPRTPSSVLVLETDTPGAITEAGPDWLRVSFDRGPGVLFVARNEGFPDAWYELASDAEPGGEPRRVRDIADSIARVGNRRYKVIYGAEAHLLIDSAELQRMLESRPRARGREPR